METFVARQPIFNSKRQIVAFELLFRNGLENIMPDVDGDKASAQLLANTFLNIGINTLTEGKKAFINFTENLLLQRIPLILPAKNTVVEVLETVTPSSRIVEVCREIAAKGYILALDDFVYSAAWRELMDVVRIIKVDFRDTSEKKIKEIMSIKTKKPLIFLAEKIESYDEFKKAIALGFSLFQGYFFCKPEIIQGKDIKGQYINLLQITAEINREDTDFDRIEALINKDVGIAYTLLRYINSAFFKRLKEISSIRQALIFLGVNEIRRFVAIVALTKACSNKPEALLKTSCIRAKFCERLGTFGTDKKSAHELYTLGIFSLLDAILDESMDRILAKIPLSKNIKDALLYRKGKLYPYLALAIAYEQGNWDMVPDISSNIDISENLIPGLYLEACEWCRFLPAS